MRSALLLLGGALLLLSGIAVFVLGVPGAVWLGPGLIVTGLLAKTCGFLVGDDPRPPEPGARRVTTLTGQEVERPRAAFPSARSSALRRGGPSGRPSPVAHERSRAS